MRAETLFSMMFLLVLLGTTLAGCLGADPEPDASGGELDGYTPVAERHTLDLDTSGEWSATLGPGPHSILPAGVLRGVRNVLGARSSHRRSEPGGVYAGCTEGDESPCCGGHRSVRWAVALRPPGHRAGEPVGWFPAREPGAARVRRGAGQCDRHGTKQGNS